MAPSRYALSLYCECGVTIQYSGIEGRDADTREAIEALIKQHTSQHEQVTAAEARKIRDMERRRIRPRKRRQPVVVMSGQVVRSFALGNRSRRRPWHGVAQPAMEDGRRRTLCGLPAEGMEEHLADFDPDGPDACANCASRLAR